MNIFPFYSLKQNIQSHIVCKYSKGSTNKLCHIMKEWKFWREGRSNLKEAEKYSSSKESSWLQPVLHLAVVSVAKIIQGWVFIGFLLQMLKTKYFDRDGYRTFIVQISSRKKKTFFVSLNHLEKDFFQRDLQVRITVFVYLVLIPTQTIFPSCFNPWIDNLTSATFHLWVFTPVKISSRYMTTNFCASFM